MKAHAISAATERAPTRRSTGIWPKLTQPLEPDADEVFDERVLVLRVGEHALDRTLRVVRARPTSG